MSLWTGFVKMGILPDANMEQEIKGCFEEYILYEPGDRKGERLWKHTACGAHEYGPLAGKAGQRITCPYCGEWAKLVASNRAKTGSSLAKWEKILWFKELNGELFAVAADCGLHLDRNSFEGPDWQSSVIYYPRQIYHWKGPGTGKPEVWYNSYIGWEWSDSPWEPFNGMGTLAEYAVFGWKEIERTSMRYCAAEKWADSSFGQVYDGMFLRGIVRYMNRYQMEPKLEQVCKWGLTSFANAYINERKLNKRLADWNAKTPWEFLRMTKQQYREFITYDPEGGLDLLKDNYRRWKLPPDQLVRLCRKVAEPYDRWGYAALDINEKYGISLKEITKYLARGGAAYTWRDYLNMANRCGWDMKEQTVLFPKDLTKAHDRAMETQRAITKEQELRRLAERDQAYTDRYEALKKKYSYRSGDLEIVVPTGAADLVREGNTLHICVGGYAQRHLEGKTDIVFLRHARRPERSYICIEVRNNQIIQVHGYKNEQYKDRHGNRPVPPMKRYEAFINEWMAWVKAGSHRTQMKGQKQA